MINIDTKRETNFAVKLTPCHLRENTYIARVPRKTVTTDQILDLVTSHNQGIDRYQVGHAMELLKKENPSIDIKYSKEKEAKLFS